MTPDSYIELVEHYSHPPARVWRVLTDPALMARWLMPNDFRLQRGHAFTLDSPPIPKVGHDGTAHCRVLDFEVERFLAISFASHGGSGLDSTITWTLAPEGEGTRLTLLHHGFDPDDPAQQLSRRMMGSGWPSILRKLGSLAAT